MKLKYFLRGLGTGILLTALLLCISYRSGDSGAGVVEQAEKLGMVFPEGTQPPAGMTEEPAATSSPAATAKSSASGAGITGDETPKPSPKKKESVSDKEKTKSSPSPKPAGKIRKFTVRDGLLSSSVAREMKEAGIIKDADAFDRYLEKSGNARKVRSGTYEIPSGASYEEIARIITRQ